MRIDREKVKKSFAKYTEQYNAEDPKIKLKIDHTYRVAAISDRIARWLELSEQDIDLAWLIGMLHDIGRFEQLRRYGTFSDADSIDHAKFGVQLLFQDGLIEDYLPEKVSDKIEVLSRENEEEKNPLFHKKDRWEEEIKKILSIIEIAIANHNEYRIEEGLDPQTKQFCQIIRDADKIDILRVNYEVPIEEIYNVSTEEVKKSVVTQEVAEAFLEHHAVLRALKKTAVDNIIGHCALVFELVYPISVKIVQQQGYLKELLDFASENPETRRQFALLRKDMNEYMNHQIEKHFHD